MSNLEELKRLANEIEWEISNGERMVSDAELTVDFSYATVEIHSFDVNDYEIDTDGITEAFSEVRDRQEQLAAAIEQHECMPDIDGENVWGLLHECIDFLKRNGARLQSERDTARAELDTLKAEIQKRMSEPSN